MTRPRHAAYSSRKNFGGRRGNVSVGGSREVAMLLLPPPPFRPGAHKEIEAGDASCHTRVLLLLRSLSDSVSSLSGTLSATHPTTPIAVTNDA